MTKCRHLLPVLAFVTLVALGCAPRVTLETRGTPAPVPTGAGSASEAPAPEAGEWYGSLKESAGSGLALDVRMIVSRSGLFDAAVTGSREGAAIWTGSFDQQGTLTGELSGVGASARTAGTVTRQDDRIVGVLALTDTDHTGQRHAAELELRRGPAPSPSP